MKNRCYGNLLIILFWVFPGFTHPKAQNINNRNDSFPVNIEINCLEKLGDLKKIWRFFGCDEPNYATRKNGRKLLGELGMLAPQKVFFRSHNLLTSGDGTSSLKWGSTNAYTEDAAGKPVYDWTILDSIFDAYLSNGVRPYVEIGFMPEALSVNPEPYRHTWDPGQKYSNIYTGWAFPPKDYKKWEDLVYEWVMHCIDRYGRDEVSTWYWETWNEANIGYWQGSRDEFLKLHDHAVSGVRRALPDAPVGGPDSAGYGGEFTRAFLNHCLNEKNYATGDTGTPLNFVSFHAKGNPVYEKGHVSMNMSNQLKEIENGFKLISSYPELKDIPIIIGESDPEGCAACQGERLGYRNGTMYSSYTAASFLRKQDLALQYGVNLEGALTWAFEFEDQPFFAGFRSLATNGIDKPVLNVFRMFSIMKGNRVKGASNSQVPLEEIIANSVKNNPDVAALASIDDKVLYILLWHYHDEDVPGPSARIALSLENLPVFKGTANVSYYLVDKKHGNAYTKWLEMGSPQQPDKNQYNELEKSGNLKKEEMAEKLRIRHGILKLNINLERQGVMLLIAEIKG